MVVVYANKSSSEIPVSDILKLGQGAFLRDISEKSAEFKDIPVDRLRILYNGKVVNEESLQTITDDDAIRVISLPDSNLSKSIPEDRRRAVDSAIASFATLWRNPEDRRLHGFAYDFSQPEHVPNLLKAFPELANEPEFLSVLSDWSLFYSYCIANEFKDFPVKNEFKYKSAVFSDVLKKIYVDSGTRYGFGRPTLRPGRGGQRQPQQAPPITAQLLQNALQAALGGVVNPQAAGSSRAGPAPPPAQAPPAQPEPEPMETDYTEKIATLRSFGFENEELITLALEQSNGDLQGAMEFLIEMNQS